MKDWFEAAFGAVVLFALGYVLLWVLPIAAALMG